jgi:uroporphyrinogen decarboxylase
MNSRERLETSLNHKEPDQVPIDLGGIVTGITTGANESVKSLLGIESNDPVVDRVQQLANPSDAVLERLDVDTRYIYLQASRDWQDIEIWCDPKSCLQSGWVVAVLRPCWASTR